MRIGLQSLQNMPQKSRRTAASRIRPLALLCLAFVSSVMANAEPPFPWDVLHVHPTTTQPGPPGYFPSIDTEALDKTPLHLPSQLEGKLNLLLLSWARDQQPQVDTWTAAGQALQHTHEDFRVYRMPVNDNENFIFRWWDSASLRAGETDPQLLHWDVPLYTDKATLVRAIGLPHDEHKIVAILVDPSGHILWKFQGPSTPQSRAGLLAAAGGFRAIR
jgi:hypothetical protein